MPKILIIKNGKLASSITQFFNKKHFQCTIIVSYLFFELHPYNYIVNYVFSFDALIILGGPQSLTNIYKYPYLLKLVNIIKLCFIFNKPLLGICLGCQLIAVAKNYKIKKMSSPMIGFYHLCVKRTSKFIKNIDPTCCFISFHYDSIVHNYKKQNDLMVAYSSGHPYILQISNCILGVQFHPEIKYNLFDHYFKSKHCPLNRIKIRTIRDLFFSNIHCVHYNGRAIINNWIHSFYPH